MGELTSQLLKSSKGLPHMSSGSSDTSEAARCEKNSYAANNTGRKAYAILVSYSARHEMQVDRFYLYAFGGTLKIM